MKLRVLLILMLLSSLMFLGQDCNRAGYGADDPKKIHVGIVFDIGRKDDRSFNAAAWVGVKCAETGHGPNGAPCKDENGNDKPALDIVLRDVEPGNPTSIEPAMRAFAERNYDLVIGVGFAQGPIMQMVARDYPNIHFAIIDGVIFEDDGKTPKANVASLVFKEHEGSYLVGIIASKTTRTNKLGFVGGVDVAVYDIVKTVVDHRFQGGFHVFGLESEGVGFAYGPNDCNKDLISEEIRQEVEVAKKKIIAGQIKVTDAMLQ